MLDAFMAGYVVLENEKTGHIIRHSHFALEKKVKYDKKNTFVTYIKNKTNQHEFYLESDNEFDKLLEVDSEIFYNKFFEANNSTIFSSNIYQSFECFGDKTFIILNITLPDILFDYKILLNHGFLFGSSLKFYLYSFDKNIYMR
jgi:hypothetical protein